MRLALFLVSSALYAADVSGIWIGEIPGRRGMKIEVSFRLKQAGTTLTGKQYGDFKSGRIVEGTVNGDQVEFLVGIPEQQGNQINEARLRYTGKLVGEELELTRSREAAVDAFTGVRMNFKETPKVTFRLQKLI